MRDTLKSNPKRDYNYPYTMGELKVAPAMDVLRSDPRFAELLRRVNLPRQRQMLMSENPQQLNTHIAPGENRYYEFGPFRFDIAERQLLRSGQEIPLTPKAFQLLHALVEANTFSIKTN